MKRLVLKKIYELDDWMAEHPGTKDDESMDAFRRKEAYQGELYEIENKLNAMIYDTSAEI